MVAWCRQLRSLISSYEWRSTRPVSSRIWSATRGASLTAARNVLVIRSISVLSLLGSLDAVCIFVNNSFSVSTFPVMTVSRRSVSASPSSVPMKCWLVTTCPGLWKLTCIPSDQAPSSCRLVVAWSESSLITVALKNGWTSTALDRYNSLVFDFDVLSHFLRILEKAVPLISTNCWSLLRSVANCWKPSSNVVNFDERLELP